MITYTINIIIVIDTIIINRVFFYFFTRNINISINFIHHRFNIIFKIITITLCNSYLLLFNFNYRCNRINNINNNRHFFYNIVFLNFKYNFLLTKLININILFNRYNISINLFNKLFYIVICTSILNRGSIFNYYFYTLISTIIMICITTN